MRFCFWGSFLNVFSCLVLAFDARSRILCPSVPRPLSLNSLHPSYTHYLKLSKGNIMPLFITLSVGQSIWKFYDTLSIKMYQCFNVKSELIILIPVRESHFAATSVGFLCIKMVLHDITTKKRTVTVFLHFCHTHAINYSYCSVVLWNTLHYICSSQTFWKQILLRSQNYLILRKEMCNTFYV